MKIKKISFDEYYQNIYSDSWHNLKESLLIKSEKIGLNWIDGTVVRFVEAQDSPNENHRQIYWLDYASFLAANYLQISSDDKILDLCAAPGGKSLSLIFKQLLPQSKTIFENHQLTWELNEISPTRRNRLKIVAHQYLSDYGNFIKITGHDGQNYGLIRADEFSKILLDAPCSGEKHLLDNPKELGKWTSKRTQKLQKLQFSLLCSALLALKKNGTLLYCTCSINPQENDDIINKAIERKAHYCQLDIEDLEVYVKNFSNIPVNYQKTKLGLLVIPTKEAPWGPLYFSRLKRI